VLPELAGHVLICRILACELHRDRQHVQTVHSHPTRAVGLLDMASGGKRSTAIKDADVVETKEAPLKNIPSFSVLAIDPPVEVEQKLVEHAREKFRVALPVALLVDFVDSPRGPRVNRRVHVTEGPLICRQLSVGVHLHSRSNSASCSFAKSES